MTLGMSYRKIKIIVSSAALVLTTLAFAMPTSNTNGNFLGVCEVHNRLLEYDINGVPWSINVPECVVSTAYVIRSTITTDPQGVAQFVEENRSCCCEITKFTRRQIRIGHMLHKYNEIETCTCKPCDEVLDPTASNVVEEGGEQLASVAVAADAETVAQAELSALATNIDADELAMQQDQPPQDQPQPEVHQVQLEEGSETN